MKVTEFFKPLKRRLFLAGALLVAAGTAALFARGEWEGGESGKHRREHTAGFYQTEKGFAQGAVPAVSGGFISPLVTTAEVQTFADEMPVRLRGNIAQALGDEQYEFRDSDGAITVKIKRGAWNGVLVDSQDTVEITGTVIKSFFKRVIRAGAIQKLQSGTLPGEAGS